jgi:hypothetical protein
MRMAMEEAAAVDTAASVEEDTLVSAVARILAEAVVPTVEEAAMTESTTHPEFRLDATAATADMGRGTTHREFRLEGRFMVWRQIAK